MCSLNLNSTINDQIESSGNQRSSIEKKLEDLAFAADRDNSGPLDELHTHRKRMPPKLRGIRKRTVGYHRLYYSGDHKNCYYDACYLYTFKQGDKTAMLDDDARFQKHLIAALADKSVVRVIEDSNERALKEKQAEESKAKNESWKEAPWYKKFWS